MCTINFVREFGLMMEEARRECLGCRERMLWIALFYIANDRAKYNAQTQTYEWPEGFFVVPNYELDSYCDLNKKAVLDLRNRLKQRGYIDFSKGDRNAEKPMYKLNYLSLREFGGENAPKEGPNMYPNNTTKEGPNMYPNDTPKRGPYIYKYKQGINEGVNPDIHTQSNNEEHTGARPRAGTYIGLDGKEHPCRFDTAWMISAKARGAVAQRLYDGFVGPDGFGTSTAHATIDDLLFYGMPPELIEDLGAELSKDKSRDKSSICTAIKIEGWKRGYTEENYEWRRCLAMANGNIDFAQRLFSDWKKRQDVE